MTAVITVLGILLLAALNVGLWNPTIRTLETMPMVALLMASVNALIHAGSVWFMVWLVKRCEKGGGK